MPCLFDAPQSATNGKKRGAPNGGKAGASSENSVSNEGAAGGLEEQGESSTAPPNKRSRILTRTKLSAEQMAILSAAFVSNPMPDTFKRHLLAAHLGLTPRCVHVWFQNRRQRLKVSEPKPVLVDGQFEWRNLLAGKSPTEAASADEPQIEAEPALQALAAMHKKAVLAKGPPIAHSFVPKVAPAKSAFVHSTSVHVGAPRGSLDLLLACADGSQGLDID